MIFVTVGTEKFPFDRLIKAVEEGVKNKEIDQDVFAQIGCSNYKPSLFPYERFISFDKMVEIIKRVEIIVSHAGEGTTLLCLSLGKIPIVMPRQGKEHVDNHQIELAKRLGDLGKVLDAYTEKELIQKIRSYNEILADLKPDISDNSKEELINYLRGICTLEKKH